jgi:thiosulfate reductase cytochrome b subunit
MSAPAAPIVPAASVVPVAPVELPRHAAVLRATHWTFAALFAVFVVSGIAIVIAHPRFYWGESGFFDLPAAFELPIPTTKGHTSWGRNLHYLAVWIAVVNAAVYMAWGFRSRHFRSRLWPSRDELRWKHVRRVLGEPLRFAPPASVASTRADADAGLRRYNVLQKSAYLGVLVIVFPALFLTGLTMSPAVTAAAPWLFTLFGGRQSARTLHFIAAVILVVFVAVHVTMVLRSGIRRTLWPMITGRGW